MDKRFISSLIIIGSLIIGLGFVTSFSGVRDVCAAGALCPTPTDTEIPPTSTDTEIPPTPTDTEVPPTPTDTDVPPTPTDTEVPPTPTDTEMPPTPTDTEIPPTPTDTEVPPTFTPTGTEVPPTFTPTPTDTLIPPTITPTHDPGTPTVTLSPTGTPTYLPPTPTSTNIPTNTPTFTSTTVPTFTSTPLPKVTETPYPPKPAVADGMSNYPGERMGMLRIGNSDYELYRGVKADDGSLLLPSYHRGAAYYQGVLWMHRSWHSGWVNLQVGSVVIINGNSYKVVGIHNIAYGVYPKVINSGFQYIATCYADISGKWSGVQLYKVERIKEYRR
jgi:hypothetical protein